tara:strand:- start:100382 stop:101788 length:1407 start_codon:yes stop_codon:yes gene_type:complete
MSITVRDYHTEVPGCISEDGLAWIFPQITSTNSHGKQIEWRVHVKATTNMDAADPKFVPVTKTLLDNKPLVGIYGWIKVESRVSGGKIKDSVPTIVKKGKNLKSSSATNAFCQALRDAYGIHNKQAKKSKKPDTYPPMLAQVVVRDKIVYPVFVQTKYNGVRAVTHLVAAGVDAAGVDAAGAGEITMYSRGMNKYTGFDDITTALKPIFDAHPDVYLDGELYSHGANLQDISGAARRDGKSNIPITYMIYDCFTAGDTRKYSERLQWLRDNVDNNVDGGNVDGGNVDNVDAPLYKLVPTYVCDDWESIELKYKEFLTAGFEGAMIRLDAEYRHSYNAHHCKQLLKLKPTLDAEFKIIGWTVGKKGKADGALMMVCELEPNAANTQPKTLPNVQPNAQPNTPKTFPVTPAMEIIERVALAKKMPVIEENKKSHFENNYLGKPLIVYFAERSKDGLPQQGRTKMEIRTWE